MGDRVSIQFVNGREKSVVLFSHWGGMRFVTTAEQYARRLETQTKGEHCFPLERFEPSTVMVDFIREITHPKRPQMGNLYLCRSPKEGDNSDNGHHLIRLVKED
jgi:hypothetical protein